MAGLMMTRFTEKRLTFTILQTWFDAQLDQKILDGIYQYPKEEKKSGRDIFTASN
jgi:hypothetical protein